MESNNKNRGLIEDMKHEYSETCKNIRYYSSTRFRLLAIYFVLIGGFACFAPEVIKIEKHSIFLIYLIKNIGLFITIIFLCLSIITEKHLQHLYSVAYSLEKKLGYTQLSTRPHIPFLRGRYISWTFYGIIIFIWLLLLYIIK